MLDKPRIILDVDGVVVNLVQKCREFLYLETGIEWDPESQETHKFANIPTVGAYFDRYLNLPHFFRWAYLYPDAENFVWTLDAIGEVHFVTAVRGAGEMDRYSFLRDQFPFIPGNRIHLTHDKGDVEGEVAIDDYEDYLTLGDRKLRILMSRPHNLKVDERAIGAIRAHTFGEVIYQVNEYTARRRSVHFMSQAVVL